MNNIFENAKFGDKFRTRDDRMAIFVGHETCWIDGDACETGYFRYGQYLSNKECDIDIIGRWEESLNEEELDKLAEEYSCKEYGNTGTGHFAGINDFKAGYRKALETIKS